MSIQISKIMSRVSDSLIANWDEMTENQQERTYRELVLEHLPQVLVDRVGDSLVDRNA